LPGLECFLQNCGFGVLKINGLMKNKKVKFLDLGLKDYQEAWDFQEGIFKEIVDIKIKNRTDSTELETPNYLVFCQHPHVYTLGKSGKQEHLLLDEEGLESKNASFYKINRGGDITYHGPGQLVGYPVLDLDNFFTDIHKYMRLLEEAIILTIADFGIKGERIEGLTGVWINPESPRKICAMGVKSSRWVTMHGFALNVNTDLGYFKNIVPCGIDDKAVCSMESELGNPMDMQEVAVALKKHLSDLFEMELI
jgi:lipoyl(octanoyl) transferase